MPLFADLFWYAVIFLGAWLIYFLLHVGGARLGLIRGVGFSTVALALAATILAGVLAWAFAGARFSSSSVHLIASITAPLCFLGFSGIWVLIGPLTVDRSITLTILLALEPVAGTGLSEHQLASAIPFDRIYRKRLRELMVGGVIEPINGDFRVTTKGLRTLCLYRWLSRVLNIELQ